MKMPNMCPFEKKEKEVFFRLTTFFFRNKKKFFKDQLLFSFLCIIKQKKNSERSEKKIFENFLNIFRKIFQNLFFSDCSEIFFCFIIPKKLNKSCSLKKNFLFLKKKVVSLKKTSFSFFSKVQWQIIFLFNVLALENILVALTREIGDGPCFLYWKLFWVGVAWEWTAILLHTRSWVNFNLII